MASPNRAPTGAILYRGPSLIDDAPIVVVATWKTNNRKTGDMVQTWILRSDMRPADAVKDGSDVSICGDCVHRGRSDGTVAKGRSCYVNVAFAPSSVYRAFKAGSYPDANPEIRERYIANRIVRFGSYGDPAAVPMDTWRPILAIASGWAGYTHQWRADRARAYRGFLMASADSDADVDTAVSLGWRTFRVRRPDGMIRADEIICPASDEAGKVRSCSSCQACRGNPTGRSGSRNVVIVAHGGKGLRTNAARNVD